MLRIAATLVLGSLVFIGSASRARADIVIVDGRYFTDRSTITGSFYSTGSEKGDQVVLKFGFGGLMGREAKLLCSDKWDWENIKKAMLKLKKYVDSRDVIDPDEMLKELGFTVLKRL